ncbi:helix-turn-helix domain-containing protein [Patescibacteria group bacterium]|nr:helix-turn-helix domain-containing protein [Patescibacteria group bacterium]
MNKTLYVDRIEASKILKVSTRTIDRYMRKHRFKTRKDGRRVLIKRVDVDKIIKEHIGRLVDINEDNFNDLMNGNGSDNMSSLAVKDFKVKKIKQGEPGSAEERVYKDLYHEVKNELKEKQERLEAATYRVGQLESQTKSMIPMLDFTKKEKELQEAYVTIEQKNKQAGEVIEILQNKIRSERIAKWIYLSLVGLLLVAEPILFLLWAFA